MLALFAVGDVYASLCKKALMLHLARGEDGRITAVLHEGKSDSPEAAVQAAIATEHRTKS